MMRVLRCSCFGALALVVAVGLTGCQAKSEAAAPHEEASPAAAPKTTGNADSVELDPSMLANIQIEKVREQSLPKTLNATGKVQLNEDQTARVLAPLPGQVIDLKLRVGDTVVKDEVLFSLKSREVSGLVTDYLESQHEQDLANKTYTMTKDLFDHQAAARIALQQAETDLAKAQAHVAHSEEALRVYGLDPKQAGDTNGVRALVPVRAPISGAVIERTVTPGQFVQGDNTPLITIADLNTTWVMVDVFESDLHLVHPGQQVKVTAAAYPDKQFMAEVNRISDRVDADTRTIKVRLLVSNPGQLLKPEMFITASLVLSESALGVTIPAKALFSEGDHSYAFVAMDDRRFERRSITAVPEGAGRVRVSHGIRAGDRVVTDGALLLRFRQQQQEQPN